MKELLGTKVLDKDGKAMYKISIKKDKEEPIYSYDNISEYAFYYRNDNDKSREEIYNKDNIGERFNITLEDFITKCEEEWKNYERTFDEHWDIEQEYEIEDYDNEEEDEW